MSNIYLCITRPVAAFMRSQDVGDTLKPDEPVVFSPYSEEYSILEAGLRVIPESEQGAARGYSQTAWQNMLCGRAPNGGKTIIKRSPDEWLTFSELCALECVNNRYKRDSYDFLCIQMPREIYDGEEVVRTGKTFTLDTKPANDLRKVLRKMFVRTLLEFDKKSQRFAQAKGFRRTDVEILERFFAKYDIPVSHDQKERDSIRRQLHRWRQEGEKYIEQDVLIGDEDITRIDDYELRGGIPDYN